MDNSNEVMYLSEANGGPPPRTPRPWTQQEKDRAKRAADIINEAIAENGMDWELLKHGWFAFRLSDGGTNTANGKHIIYESKQAAVRDQLHEQQCAYVAMRNLIGGATANELLRFFRFTEDAYDAGFRLPDPDDPTGGPDLAPTAAHMDAISGILRQRRN